MHVAQNTPRKYVYIPKHSRVKTNGFIYSSIYCQTATVKLKLHSKHRESESLNEVQIALRMILQSFRKLRARSQCSQMYSEEKMFGKRLDDVPTLSKSFERIEKNYPMVSRYRFGRIFCSIFTKKNFARK